MSERRKRNRKRTDCARSLWPLVRALEFRPLFDGKPPFTHIREPNLLGGYTSDETRVCTIDARQPDGFFGIHAGFEVGPKNDYFAEHLTSMEAAKEWAQQAWREILVEWLCPNTEMTDANSKKDGV